MKIVKPRNERDFFLNYCTLQKKNVPVHAMMACQTDEEKVHAFLTQQEMEVSGQLHVPTALTQVKETPVPIIKIAQCVPETVWVVLGREKPTDPAGSRRTIPLLA